MPNIPNATPITEVLKLSAPLVQLRQRLADSAARFEAIRSSLPAALAPHVKPGPVDEEGWSLLAANAAVGAKLRQLQPRLVEVLEQQGWRGAVIRIKVLA